MNHQNSLVLKIITLFMMVALLSACTPGTPTPTNTPGSGGSGAGGTAAGSTDAATGVSMPPFAPAPSGASAPARSTSVAHGSAVIAISGDLPIVLSGGDCDFVGEELFLTIYPGTQAGVANLIISPGTGPTRVGSLVWTTSSLPQNNGAVSAEDPLVVTLNEDGFSGSFEGRAFRVGGPGEPVAVPIVVSGSFTCISHLIRVGGDHPVDLTGVTCVAAPAFSLRSGTPGTNAALLMAADGATAGSTVAGGLSWRVGGVNYVTSWLSLHINSDGLSGSYFGEASGPDGRTFTVSGSFNCL